MLESSTRCNVREGREAKVGKQALYTRQGIDIACMECLYPIWYMLFCLLVFIPDRGNENMNMLIELVKERRKALGMTQAALADRAGVGLRFVRDLEQGKESLRLDKVNQVLALFGHRMGPVPFRVEIADEDG